jgi:hypothetical protein
VRPEVAVGEREQRGGQHREDHQHEQLVTSMFQVKIGIRNIVMPGARIVMMVVMKLTAPRIVPKTAQPQTDDPQVSADAGRERGASDSGA